jgi:hypothetical protein
LAPKVQTASEAVVHETLDLGPPLDLQPKRHHEPCFLQFVPAGHCFAETAGVVKVSDQAVYTHSVGDELLVFVDDVSFIAGFTAKRPVPHMSSLSSSC